MFDRIYQRKECLSLRGRINDAQGSSGAARRAPRGLSCLYPGGDRVHAHVGIPALHSTVADTQVAISTFYCMDTTDTVPMYRLLLRSLGWHDFSRMSSAKTGSFPNPWLLNVAGRCYRSVIDNPD